MQSFPLAKDLHVVYFDPPIIIIMQPPPHVSVVLYAFVPKAWYEGCEAAERLFIRIIPWRYH